MTPTTPALASSRTLADLAGAHAGASRVFQRHGLDFCCHGLLSLDAACAERALEPEQVLSEIRAEAPPDDEFVRWDEQALSVIVEHILTQYHASHRSEVPRLIELAHKVGRVHADKPACPRGLAAHLEFMARELEQHMLKEEELLFPMLLAGDGATAAMPIQVMELEHQDHGKNLARLRALAHDFAAPPEACGTWRALYLGLSELEGALMRHIHLENHVLFPMALRA